MMDVTYARASEECDRSASDLSHKPFNIECDTKVVKIQSSYLWATIANCFIFATPESRQLCEMK